MEQNRIFNKEQTLSELYALRAGLSAISLENDKVQTIYFNSEFSAYADEMDEEEKKAKQRQNVEYFKAQNDITLESKYRAEKENAIEKSKKRLTEAKRNQIRDYILFPLFLIALIACVAVYIFYAPRSILASEICIPAGIATLIGTIIFGKSAMSANRRIKSEEQLIQYDNMQFEKAVETQAKIARIRKEASEQIVPIQKSCEQFYSVMQTEFARLLDERDWENLDLVIYYLETGRADGMKEALQLVDRELQTQRIVDAIKQASYEICRTIERGFASLQTTMVQCFRSLSAQIAATAAVQSAQLARLTQSVNLNNALREKANVTSTQLMSDVRQIRNYVCN